MGRLGAFRAGARAGRRAVRARRTAAGEGGHPGGGPLRAALRGRQHLRQRRAVPPSAGPARFHLRPGPPPHPPPLAAGGRLRPAGGRARRLSAHRGTLPVGGHQRQGRAARAVPPGAGAVLRRPHPLLPPGLQAEPRSGQLPRLQPRGRPGGGPLAAQRPPLAQPRGLRLAAHRHPDPGPRRRMGAHRPRLLRWRRPTSGGRKTPACPGRARSGSRPRRGGTGCPGISARSWSTSPTSAAGCRPSSAPSPRCS